jgi:succinate dehydrogenase/fumarate reductase-like Fe-S protein
MLRSTCSCSCSCSAAVAASASASSGGRYNYRAATIHYATPHNRKHNERVHSVGGDDSNGSGRCRVLAVCTEARPHGLEKYGMSILGDDVPHVGIHVFVSAPSIGCSKAE